MMIKKVALKFSLLYAMLFLTNPLLIGQETQTTKVLDLDPFVYTNKDEIDIYYDLDNKQGAIAKVELWITRNGGKTWELNKFDKDLRPPVKFIPSTDHIYGFKIIAIDDVGNKTPAPSQGTQADIVYIVDRKAPEIALKNITENPQKIGSDLMIDWVVADLHLEDLPISIHLSLDDGKSWNLMHSGLKKEEAFPIKVPHISKESFRIKVTAIDKAGNKKSAISHPIQTDGYLPYAKAISPHKSNSKSFLIEVKAYDNGIAGVKSLSLWFTKDHGKTWKLFKRDLNPIKPIRFIAENKGEIGFYVVAQDTAGNKGIEPTQGTAPQLITSLDNEAPKVKFANEFNSKTFKGGSAFKIKWIGQDTNLKEHPVSIYFSQNSGNVWKKIVSNEKNTGIYNWHWPMINSDKCMLKIELIDQFNNIGEDISSDFFTIDSIAPITKAMYAPGQGIPQLKSTLTSPKPMETTKELDKKTAQKDCNEIDKLIQENHYEIAIDKIKICKSNYPESPKPFFQMAQIYSIFLAEDSPFAIDNAINELSKAIAIDTEYEEAYILLGSLYFKKYTLAKKDDKKKQFLLLAEHEYLNAIKILGDNYEEYSNLGMIYYQMNDFHSSKKFLLKASLLKEKPALCYWYLARISEHFEDFIAAERFWQKAAKAFGVNSIYGEKAILNIETAKNKKVRKEENPPK